MLRAEKIGAIQLERVEGIKMIVPRGMVNRGWVLQRGKYTPEGGKAGLQPQLRAGRDLNTHLTPTPCLGWGHLLQRNFELFVRSFFIT